MSNEPRSPSSFLPSFLDHSLTLTPTYKPPAAGGSGIIRVERPEGISQTMLRPVTVKQNNLIWIIHKLGILGKTLADRIKECSYSKGPHQFSLWNVGLSLFSAQVPMRDEAWVSHHTGHPMMANPKEGVG